MVLRNVKKTVHDLNFYRDWIAKRENALDRVNKLRTTYFITLSREFGCEGAEVADAIIERMNKISSTPWEFFDRTIIDNMISSDEFPPELVTQISESRWSIKDWFIDSIVPKYLQSPSSRIFQRMENLILNMVDKGNCVFLGCGAQILTQRLDPKKHFGIHVRLVAPISFRIEKLMRKYNISRDEAENMIKTRQVSRDKFISDLTGMEATDPLLYDMIFNNARLRPELIATLVEEHFRETGVFDYGAAL